MLQIFLVDIVFFTLFFLPNICAMDGDLLLKEKNKLVDLQSIDLIETNGQLCKYLGYAQDTRFKDLKKLARMLGSKNTPENKKVEVSKQLICLAQTGFIPAQLMLDKGLLKSKHGANMAKQDLKYLAQHDPNAAIYLLNCNQKGQGFFLQDALLEKLLNPIREFDGKKYAFLPHVNCICQRYVNENKLNEAQKLQIFIAEKMNTAWGWYTTAKYCELAGDYKTMMSCLKNALNFSYQRPKIIMRYISGLIREYVDEQPSIDECVRLLQGGQDWPTEIIENVYAECLKRNKIDFLGGILKELSKKSYKTQAIIFLKSALASYKKGDQKEYNALMGFVQEDPCLCGWYGSFLTEQYVQQDPLYKQGEQLIAKARKFDGVSSNIFPEKLQEIPVFEQTEAEISQTDQVNTKKRKKNKKKKKNAIEDSEKCKIDQLDSLRVALKKNDKEEIISCCKKLNSYLISRDASDIFFKKIGQAATDKFIEKLKKYGESASCAITIASILYFKSSYDLLNIDEIIELVEQAKAYYLSVDKEKCFSQLELDETNFDYALHYIYKSLGDLYTKKVQAGVVGLASVAEEAFRQAGDILVSNDQLQGALIDYSFFLLNSMRNLSIEYFYQLAKRGCIEAIFYYLHLFDAHELEHSKDHVGQSLLKPGECREFKKQLNDALCLDALKRLYEDGLVDIADYNDWKLIDRQKRNSKYLAADNYLQGIEAFFQDKYAPALSFFKKAESLGVSYAKKYLAIIPQTAEDFGVQLPYARECLKIEKRDERFADDLYMFGRIFRNFLPIEAIIEKNLKGLIDDVQCMVDCLKKTNKESLIDNLNTKLYSLQQYIRDLGHEELECSLSNNQLKAVLNSFQDLKKHDAKMLFIIALLLQRLAEKNQIIYETSQELYRFYENHLFPHMKKEDFCDLKSESVFANFVSTLASYEESQIAANPSQKEDLQIKAESYHKKALSLERNNVLVVSRFANFYLNGNSPDLKKNKKGALDKGMSFFIENAARDARVAQQLAAVYRQGANFPVGRIAPNEQKADKYQKLAQSLQAVALHEEQTFDQNEQIMQAHKSSDDTCSTDDEQSTEDDET